MDGRDFYQRVWEHAELEWLGVRPGPTPADDQVLIGHHPREAVMSLAVSAVIDHGWAELVAVITGRREPRIMRHIARIVGYYSIVQNWNRSKVAELRDRHRGTYAVPEPGMACAPRQDVIP